MENSKMISIGWKDGDFRLFEGSDIPAPGKG